MTGHYNPVFKLPYSVNHLKNSKISSSHMLNIYLIQSNIVRCKFIYKEATRVDNVTSYTLLGALLRI